MRAAVYSGTRNIYSDMVTAAKSLVANSSVDKIYFLIEDKTFPEKLPPIIETINVSGQKYFASNSANFCSPFSYMSLLRVCYTKILPDLDKVLQLDVDTICVDNVDALWEIDMNGKWFAAVEEYLSTYKPFGTLYYNIGVAMFNLKQIAEEHADDLLIRYLNTCKTPYIDQDAWNRHMAGRDLRLPLRYNECFVTGYTDSPAIVHYAGFKDWQTSNRVSRREYRKRYQEMTWKDVIDGRNTDSSTDI